MNIKLLLVLVLAGFAVLFIIQNASVVEIQFLIWSIRMSLSILMFLLLAIGILMGWSLHSYLKYRKNKTK